MVELQRVDEALIQRSMALLEGLRERLGDLPGLRVEPLGSSFWLGGLTKGDVDVGVVAQAEGWSELLARLEVYGTAAQVENWTETFASYAVSLEGLGDVGVQVVRSDRTEGQDLLRQHAALGDPAFRRRYDAAKRHGQALGAEGYGRCKEAFWSSWERSGPLWVAADAPVLKILHPHEWEALLQHEETVGAPVDVADGFVHLSTPEQVRETVERHFAGASDLWLLTLDAARLGSALRWEPSRGGALFPHLYAPLRLADVCLARPWNATTAPSDA